MFAEGGNQRPNAVTKGVNAVAEAAVRSAGFLGEIAYADAEFSHGGSQAYSCTGSFVKLALGVAPQGLGFFAVSAALLSDARSKVLDAIEAFFSSHLFPSRVP
jgi:hypothetical protein